MNLAGKTLVLTGANGGLGQEIARELAGSGARLVLVGMGLKVLENLATEFGSEALQHCSLDLDLSQEQGIEELVQFCQQLPDGIDGLINSAGLNRFALLEDHEYSATVKLFMVNLVAPIMLTARLLPLLKTRQEAMIVNIGSVLGAIGNPGYSTYCASKSGLARFSETLRRELADSPVKVLHFNPRVIKTSMNSGPVNALNDKLGNKSDSPETVAKLLVSRILNDRFGEYSVGWPEKLFVRINALLPGLVDRNFLKNLALIKSAARDEKDARVDISITQPRTVKEPATN